MVGKDWTDGWPDGNAQVPGWSGEGEDGRPERSEQGAPWPDPEAQHRIMLVLRLLASMLLGLIPAMLLRSFYPSIAWVFSAVVIFVLSGPLTKRFEGQL